MKPSQQVRIVVVEDDADDRLLLAHQFAKAQIDDHVVFMDNGREALDFLLKEPFPPIAILLDLHLPGICGIDLLERVRQEAKLKEVPVIVMTGSNDPHDVKKCSALGVMAYLPKPVDLTTLIKNMAYLFQQKAVAK